MLVSPPPPFTPFQPKIQNWRRNKLEREQLLAIYKIKFQLSNQQDIKILLLGYRKGLAGMLKLPALTSCPDITGIKVTESVKKEKLFFFFN